MKKVNLKRIKGGEWRISYPSWNGRMSEHYTNLAQALRRWVELQLESRKSKRR